MTRENDGLTETEQTEVGRVMVSAALVAHGEFPKNTDQNLPLQVEALNT